MRKLETQLRLKDEDLEAMFELHPSPNDDPNPDHLT